MAQRVGRGIALHFHDRGTTRVVSSKPRPHFTPGKEPLPVLQEAGWATGPVWTGGKSRPHRDMIPDRPARSQSLYRLSYRAHIYYTIFLEIYMEFLLNSAGTIRFLLNRTKITALYVNVYLHLCNSFL